MSNIVPAFGNANNWNAFDAQKTGILVSHPANAYGGAIYDGRYLYFTPSREEGIAFAGPDVIFHGRVLRLDTKADFYDASAWESYDARGTNGLDTRGYAGGICDGRYVYFSPWCAQGFDHHARVLRFDTQGQGFGSASSWTAYDAATADGEGHCHGYNGAIFDGRYVYFAPLFNNESLNHGRVLRYDSAGAGFGDPSSWTCYDARTTDGLLAVGYCGGVFDGRYVYFIPSASSSSSQDARSHGVVLRHDTQAGGFGESQGWQAYDAGSIDGMDTRGYSGGVFDGRYLYFVPNFCVGESWHGRVLRFDTQKDFKDSTAWEAFDAANTEGLPTVGFAGGAFDGRFVYFVPRNQRGRHLRYDTTQSFKSKLAWQAFDASRVDGLTTEGFINAAFDGRFVYFVPHIDSTNVYHCRVLRFRAREAPLIPKSVYGGSFY